MNTKLKSFILLVLFSIFSMNSLSALTMNHRRIKTVKKIIMRLLSDIITPKLAITEPSTSISFTNREIGHMVVSSANIVVTSLTSELRNAISKRRITFRKLAKRISLEASATFLEQDIQNFITYKIKKLRFRNKIFPKVSIKLFNGYIEARGKIILRKIPGNYLAMLSPKPAPFKVKFKLSIKNRKLSLRIIDGAVNGQAITEAFKKQVLTWINPIWNFKKTSFAANMTSIKISTGKISLSGTLF